MSAFALRPKVSTEHYACTSREFGQIWDFWETLYGVRHSYARIRDPPFRPRLRLGFEGGAGRGRAAKLGVGGGLRLAVGVPLACQWRVIGRVVAENQRGWSRLGGQVQA